MNGPPSDRYSRVTLTQPVVGTINTGRRAEKDAAAQAKAEARRQRKAAKRAKDVA